MKRIIVSLVAFVMITSLVGCKSTGISKEQYEEMEEKIETKVGIKATDLEDLMIEFVTLVYKPQSKEDISKGIDCLKDIATKDEIQELKEIAGKYNPNSQQEVSNITVRYGKGTYSFDEMDKILISFDLKKDDESQEIIIIFNINDENKIFKHTILEGAIR